MRPTIMVDSGAFSAWRLGKPIDLAEYCRYLKANEDWITHYIALDIINPQDRDTASKESWDNLMIMRKHGLDPMPVFHIGENIKWLEKMLNLGCEYIGVSNSSGRAEDKADDFYRYVWSHLVDSGGLPLIKIHALGEGRADRLKRFPWQSADSTSWAYTSQRTGQITMPSGHQISARKDKAHSRAKPDVGSLEGAEQDAFDAMLAELGLDPAALEIDKTAGSAIRGYITALYYMRLQQTVRGLAPVRFRPNGFFQQPLLTGPAIKTDLTLYLVQRCLEHQYAILHKLGDPPTLASYFYIMQTGNKPGQYLGDYIRDPLRYIEASPAASRYWEILEKYIK